MPDQLYFLLGYDTFSKTRFRFGKMVFEDKETKNALADKFIIQEVEEFDDLILGNFEDNYENLPIKTRLGYQFLHDRCKDKFDYVSFTDDDAFLDLTNLTSWADAHLLNDAPKVRCIKGDIINMENRKFKTKNFACHICF